MGQCESCVNTNKNAKGTSGISYGQGKKRHSKPNASGSRRGSFATSSNYGGKYYDRFGGIVSFILSLYLMDIRH